MTRILNRLVWALILLPLIPAAGRADDVFRPGDPFAAIDGSAIYLGEMNLILTQRLKARDLDRVDLEVKQATAMLLVRRHLAMKSLREQGGEALERIINREIEAVAAEAKRRGSSLEQQAESRLADEKSLKADIAWRAAWRRYLKSQLNERNLRRYFQQHRGRYAGGRWQVSQIFVDIDPRDAASVAATKERMSELAIELRQSGAPAEAFADAARQHSESPSAADGGNVGWVESDGDLPSSVMQAVRGIQPGSISDPVLSPLGMHLVYVHGHQPGELEFDELTDVSQLRRDATDALFETLVRRQSETKVVWFIKALRPPESVSLIP